MVAKSDATPLESVDTSLNPIMMLRDWLLQRVWYVHPGARVTITITPPLCMRYLEDASRPRVNRLDFGNLYAHGQRYKLHSLDELNFMMTVTHSVAWRYRRRTSSSAVVFGRFVRADASSIHLHLSARIRLFYILQFILLPLFMTSIIIYMPWHPGILAGFISALFVLSWFGHRYHAAVEAHDMVYFIQKVLDEYRPAPALLIAEGAHIDIDNADFGEAWEKFYQSHRDEA